MMARRLGEMASIGFLALAFALSGCASSSTREMTFALQFVDELQARESHIVRMR